MDYQYIYLQNQIRALMNKNYVPSSSHAASATELKNGSNTLLVDTVQKCFLFKYAGLNESVMVDPLNRSLLNVAYINGVDVSKLIGGILAGYGVIIEDQGEGVYKVSVNENMFALKSDVEEITDKFGEYVTNEAFNNKLGDELNEDETLTVTDFVNDKYDAVKNEINDKLTNEYYTKEVTDNKYALKTDSYTKEVSDTKYALKDASYTKAESEDRYAVKTKEYETTELKSIMFEQQPSGYNTSIFHALGHRFVIDGTCTVAVDSIKSFHIDQVIPNSVSSTQLHMVDGIYLDVNNYTDYFDVIQVSYLYEITSVKVEENVTKTANLIYECDIKSNYYDKTESDNKYALKNTSYTKETSDNKYALKDASYIKAESDNKYALKDKTFTKTESEGRYALKNDSYTKTESDNKYVDKNSNATLNGNLNVNALSTTYINSSNNLIINTKSMYWNTIQCINPNMTDNTITGLVVGKSANSHNVALCYREPEVGTLGIGGYNAAVLLTPTKITLSLNTEINGNLTVNGTVKSNGSNTITHYCPIEETINSINDFAVGVPVYLTGKVYKRNGCKFIPSTSTDRSDCICSVQLKGNHKTYVGVVVSIDEKNKCITFASHGDYMFNVEDSSLYEIGDVVLYDGRILEDELAVSSLLLQSVVGKITAIVDKHTVSVFKD